MSDVILIKGAVTYSITLDPSVWIFDERKIDLHSFIDLDEEEQASEFAYLKGAGAHWDRELLEGATPPTAKTSLPEMRKALEGDFGIRLSFFLDNAKVSPEAKTLRIHRENHESVDFPVDQARKAIMQFCKDGKPIRENGPVLFYLPEQLKNGGQPIDSIVIFELV